jgi:hypothetical protein
MAFWKWQQKSSPSPTPNSARANWGGAILVASAVLPIELVHHLLRGWLAMLLVSLMTLLLLLLIARKIRPAEMTLTR